MLGLEKCRRAELYGQVIAILGNVTHHYAAIAPNTSRHHFSVAGWTRQSQAK
jgi:hypothetical protein